MYSVIPHLLLNKKKNKKKKATKSKERAAKEGDNNKLDGTLGILSQSEMI